MSRCTSPIHPDGCAPGHQAPDGCYCDCHSEVVRCAECGDEYHDDMVGRILDRMLCATCAAELVAEACVRIAEFVEARREQGPIDDSTIISTIIANTGHRRDLLLFDLRLLTAVIPDA